MSHKCEFCTKEFTARYSLLYHQRTAKYCLAKRGLVNDKTICKICNRNFSEKRQLNKHEEKCNLESRYEEQKMSNQKQREIIIKLSTMLKEKNDLISKYEIQIKDLTEKLENIAVKGATKSTNTNILKIECLTQDHLTQCANMITQKDMYSISTLAEFAKNHSFKDRVSVSDQSRKTLLYKKENGKITKDPKGKQLATKFFTSIENKEHIISEIRDQIFDELKGDISETESQYILSRMTDLINIEKGIKKVAKGEEEDIRDEFVNKLCELLPNSV
jgi:uncharacterized coiled-coil protein SlyX